MRLSHRNWQRICTSCVGTETVGSTSRILKRTPRFQSTIQRSTMSWLHGPPSPSVCCVKLFTRTNGYDDFRALTDDARIMWGHIWGLNLTACPKNVDFEPIFARIRFRLGSNFSTNCEIKARLRICLGSRLRIVRPLAPASDGSLTAGQRVIMFHGRNNKGLPLFGSSPSIVVPVADSLSELDPREDGHARICRMRRVTMRHSTTSFRLLTIRRM